MKRISIILILLAALTTVGAEEMPDWILPGILMTETKSTFREDGTVHYVNKQRGHSGEIGCMQITKRAFKQVRLHGEIFWDMETSTQFSVEIGTRYLWWLYNRHHSWDRAVMEYNAGPGHSAPDYLAKVKRNGGHE